MRATFFAPRPLSCFSRAMASRTAPRLVVQKVRCSGTLLKAAVSGLRCSQEAFREIVGHAYVRVHGLCL